MRYELQLIETFVADVRERGVRQRCAAQGAGGSVIAVSCGVEWNKVGSNRCSRCQAAGTQERIPAIPAAGGRAHLFQLRGVSPRTDQSALARRCCSSRCWHTLASAGEALALTWADIAQDHRCRQGAGYRRRRATEDRLCEARTADGAARVRPTRAARGARQSGEDQLVFPAKPASCGRARSTTTRAIRYWKPSSRNWLRNCGFAGESDPSRAARAHRVAASAGARQPLQVASGRATRQSHVRPLRSVIEELEGQPRFLSRQKSSTRGAQLRRSARKRWTT